MNLAYAIRGVASADRLRRQMRRTGKTPFGHWLWTQEEDAAVQELYPDYKTLEKALKRRSLCGIQRRASTIGVAKKRHMWTSAEVLKLRRLYPKAPKEEIMQEFPDLRWSQIRSCVSYNKMRKIRQPYTATGFEVLDVIRQRAFQSGINMADLDEIAGTKTYFQRAGWCGRLKANPKAVMRAIDALGGKIEIKWVE